MAVVTSCSTKPVIFSKNYMWFFRRIDSNDICNDESDASYLFNDCKDDVDTPMRAIYLTIATTMLTLWCEWKRAIYITVATTMLTLWCERKRAIGLTIATTMLTLWCERKRAIGLTNGTTMLTLWCERKWAIGLTVGTRCWHSDASERELLA